MLRIVQEADYSIFQGNPKWVIGMNDITVLHSKLHSSESRVYTPSCLPITIQLPRKWSRNYGISFSGSFPRTPYPHTRSTDRESWKPEMIGGMLQWVHNLHDTCIERNTRGTILFIEDPSNDLYEIDRNVKCMKYAGKFQHLAGLIVGEFGKDSTPEFKEEVYKLIHDAVEDYTYPVCFGLPAGHVRNNFPLILGANVELVVHPKGAELHFPDHVQAMHRILLVTLFLIYIAMNNIVYPAKLDTLYRAIDYRQSQHDLPLIGISANFENGTRVSNTRT